MIMLKACMRELPGQVCFVTSRVCSHGVTIADRKRILDLPQLSPEDLIINKHKNITQISQILK